MDNPEAAEAAALYKAVSLALEEGFTKVCCESDAKSVIESVKDPGKSTHWTAVSFIRNIRELITFF